MMGEITEQKLEDVEALFLQTAGTLTSDGEKTLTLRGLSPSTLYFADRPQREVGHMATQALRGTVGEGENSFAIDPPNAVISFAEAEDRAPDDVVVTIRDPEMDGDSLSYRIDVLEGSMPTSTGACALFIDPFGRPLSPVSAAGMHRRARRRRI
jgi:hypothetical protein